MIRSEEQAVIERSWRPYQHIRYTKQVVVERRTIEVDVRREELLIEMVDPDDQSPGDSVPPTLPEPIVLLLHEERVEVTLLAVPYERVTISVGLVDAAINVPVTLRKEQIDVEEVQR